MVCTSHTNRWEKFVSINFIALITLSYFFLWIFIFYYASLLFDLINIQFLILSGIEIDYTISLSNGITEQKLKTIIERSSGAVTNALNDVFPSSVISASGLLTGKQGEWQTDIQVDGWIEREIDTYIRTYIQKFRKK